jgi:hypothetical protein
MLSKVAEENDRRFLMAVYVKAKKSDIWHWRKECPQYPHAMDIELMTPQRQAQGLLCRECLKLEKAEDKFKLETLKKA